MEAENQDSSFPRKVRLLRSSDFRKVYDKGLRVSGPYFSAFCLEERRQEGPRIGFTTPRALGSSVVRNRLKRRLREAVRLNRSCLGTKWDVVLNPRRRALDAPFEDLEREIKKLFLRCGS